MSRKPITLKALLREPALTAAGSWGTWLATLGPIGRCPVAPATVATALVGVPAALLLSLLPGIPAFFLVTLIVLLSCAAAETAERTFGRQDPQEVVVDELAGYLVTMVGLPWTFPSVALGFAAFRAFDIWKPWPIGWLHHNFRGGIAIVMDDVAAGIYAHLLVWTIFRLWP